MLPSQLVDTSWIPESDGSTDGKTDVAHRHLGSWGFPAPYGHAPIELRDRQAPPLGKLISFNMDIVGGATSSLCEVMRESVTSTPAGHFVNMLFETETDALTVEGPYPTGILRCSIKEGGTCPLWVRVPSWASAEAMQPRAVSSAGERTPLRSYPSGGYLLVPEATGTVELDMPLAESELVLEHRTRSIRCRLRGDSVVAMEAPPGADLTFFDPL